MDLGPPLCVALPTRDRSSLVLKALVSLAGQLEPGDELLVVDNGSQDRTRERVTSWLEQNYPQGRLVYEPKGGVSAARNAALRETQGEIVCFLDDDETLHPDWLRTLRAAWATAGDRVAVIGGSTRAEWRAPRPAWLADYLLYVISLRDLGSERRRLDPAHACLWGGNMSVRVAAAAAVGGFDEGMGARPDAPWARGEEEELQRRLATAGWEIWYEPNVIIYHLIPSERLTPFYFRTAFRNQAIRAAEEGTSRLTAVPILARAAARYLVLRLTRNAAAETATFKLVYGWTLLTKRRPKPRSAARRSRQI